MTVTCKYVSIIFTQDIWHDCIEPLEKHVAVNISNKYFSKYEMSIHDHK